jgi:ferredoxin, 2Fe-2S
LSETNQWTAGMTKLTIIAFDGTRFDLDAADGSTVMENAVRNSVPGIDAECGGACACATCHVYVDEAWVKKAGAPAAMEEDMLDFAADVRPNSRLSCQIKVSSALDGLIVRVPERQA